MNDDLFGTQNGGVFHGSYDLQVVGIFKAHFLSVAELIRRVGLMAGKTELLQMLFGFLGVFQVIFAQHIRPPVEGKIHPVKAGGLDGTEGLFFAKVLAGGVGFHC